MIVRYFLGLIFTVAAVIQDIREYKIKNKLILIFLGIGIILSAADDGIRGVGDSLLGIIIPLVLLPLFALRMLGAGDIKAFCALGALLGAKGIINLMCISFLSGGVIALIFMIFRRNGLKRFFWIFSIYEALHTGTKLDKL